MRQRPFGTTGLSVSVVGFGAGHIGDSRADAATAEGLLNAAVDAGVTFIDTARGYGLSEERVGTFLRSRRGDVVLSTKVGYGVSGVENWTVEAVRRGVEDSLRLLRTDVIDVVFLHSCSLDMLQRGEAIEAIQQAKEAGKIRVAGYSGENAALAWAVDSGAFGAVQTSVNIADQWSAHHVLQNAAASGLGVVAKRPLANAPWRYEQRPVGNYAELYWERLQTFGLQPESGDWAATALRFSAYTPGVSTAIVGTSSQAHLLDAVAAGELGPLPAAEYARWSEAFVPYANDWRGST